MTTTVPKAMIARAIQKSRFNDPPKAKRMRIRFGSKRRVASLHIDVLSEARPSAFEKTLNRRHTA